MNIINHNALIGLTTTINNAAIPVPINAPNTGIKAVNPTNTEDVNAYGILRIFIPIKQSIPKIQASNNCPPIKLLNVLLAFFPTFIV